MQISTMILLSSTPLSKAFMFNIRAVSHPNCFFGIITKYKNTHNTELVKFNGLRKLRFNIRNELNVICEMSMFLIFLQMVLHPRTG